MFFLSLIIFSNLFTFDCDKDFIQSFVKHYEFNAEGRYTHEYHPFLLNKTAISLDSLENSLLENGFNLFGRIVICGYEEQAVPTYYTNYAKPIINDEAMFKHRVGWSMRLHNKFGFMTGFLFKDIDRINEFNCCKYEPVFEHINSDKIEIFRDEADIFQEHAFGQAYPILIKCMPLICKNIKANDCSALLNTLLKFWKVLYENTIQSSGKEVAGTADIFFSIEYAKHLIRSSIPFLKFFTGPDITYPIEVSLKQKKGATKNAQDFVKVFSNQLVARDNKPTVYIFCSFVDGVGKTTLLGNVKNRLKHGDCVEDFTRVDNSSSQLADIFEFKDNVFIADLPAQISHFTYKPDGLVFVSAERELQEDLLEKVKDFVRENRVKMESEYKKLKLDVETEIKRNGFFSKKLNSRDDVQRSFIKNLFLLKKEISNLWIPFRFQGRDYLFNLRDLSDIKVLSPLCEVQSEGLKNVESEQMLFFEGIRFPLNYSDFLNDLVAKLRESKIENIIFVDFISMYPRSSRENIRINYLLQQMAIIHEEFDPRFSLYRNFINDAELLYLLKQVDTNGKFLNSFYIESIIRLAMYNIVVNRNGSNVDGIDLKHLTNLIKKELDLISEEVKLFCKETVGEKIFSESIKLEDVYGLTKSFINVQMFDLEDVYLFSEKLIQFFTDFEFIKNNDLLNMWDFPAGFVSQDQKIISDGILNKSVRFDLSNKFYGLYVFNKLCRDENLLSKFIRTLRASWYALLSNLVYSNGMDESSVEIEKIKYSVPAFIVKKDEFDNFYLIRKFFDAYDGEISSEMKKMERKFNLKPIEDSRVYGTFLDKTYRLDWESKSTNSGIYGFESDIDSSKKISNSKSIITFLVQRYQNEFGSDIVIRTSRLYDILRNSELWKRERRLMFEQAKKNGFKCDYRDVSKKNVNKKKNDKDDVKKGRNEKKDAGLGLWGNNDVKKIYLVSEKQIGSLRLFVRFIATLEMILKDPESNIVVKKWSRKDFKACIKLLEEIILPKYFGLLCENDLFDDYDNVDPVIDFELE